MTVRVSRVLVFIAILLNQSQNLSPLVKTPFLIVTEPSFVMPGIFTTEKTGLLPARYSIG